MSTLPVSVESWNAAGLYIKRKWKRSFKLRACSLRLRECDVFCIQEAHVTRGNYPPVLEWFSSRGFDIYDTFSRVSEPFRRGKVFKKISRGGIIAVKKGLHLNYSLIHHEIIPSFVRRIELCDKSSGSRLGSVSNVYPSFRNSPRRVKQLRAFYDFLSTHRWGVDTRFDILVGDCNFVASREDHWGRSRTDPNGPLRPRSGIDGSAKFYRDHFLGKMSFREGFQPCPTREGKTHTFFGRNDRVYVTMSVADCVLAKTSTCLVHIPARCPVIMQ